MQDVLDLSWSSDSATLVSASIDNSVHVWNVENPTRPVATLTQHSNFVQGVAIDPYSRLIASLGNDRSLCVYAQSNKPSQWHPVASVSSIAEAKLFVDDANFKTFFRRLTWSPDGSVLACPSGIQVPQTKRLFAVHLFARGLWTRPVAQCAALPKPACAVRFSPVLYALRDKGTGHTTSPVSSLVAPSPNASISDAQPLPTVAPQPSSTSPQSQLPANSSSCEDTASPSPAHPIVLKNPFSAFSYRMVFAVACVDAIFFYDTQSFTRPFAKVEGLHCAEHTDIAWSADGLSLVVSSVDGYASIISFTKEELGCPLSEDKIPRWMTERKLVQQSAPERTAVQVESVLADASSDPKAPSAREIACMLSVVEPQMEPTNPSLSAVQNEPSDGTPRKFSRLVSRGDKTQIRNAHSKPMVEASQAGDIPRPTVQPNTTQGYRISAHPPSNVSDASASPGTTIVQPKRRITPTSVVETVFNVQKDEKTPAATPVETTIPAPRTEIPKFVNSEGGSSCVAAGKATGLASVTPFVRSVVTFVSDEGGANEKSGAKRKANFDDATDLKQRKNQNAPAAVDLS